MTYKIVIFDGLVISPYLQHRGGDQQDLGTGAALSSFLPLPGGGFYDNYQDKRSPQGIRPINKSGIFWGTDAELRAELQAWRAKLGKRGRLTVEWDDGTLMWQWARLQDVSAPRATNAKGGWLPFSLTWITAAQNWRGVVHGEEGWTWGDGSWTWGDGSAEMGEGGVTFELTGADETLIVPHGGNIDAPNVTLRYHITGEWQDLTIINETTGQQIFIDRASTTARAMLELNAGARTLYVGGTESVVSSMHRDQNLLQVTTTGAHGISAGDTVRIEGTGEYDGDHYPIVTEGATDFYAILPPSHTGYGAVTTGTVRWLANIYSLATFSDRSRWLVLAPGDNVIRLIWAPFPTTATLTVEYTDHYG